MHLSTCKSCPSCNSVRLLQSYTLHKLVDLAFDKVIQNLKKIWQPYIITPTHKSNNKAWWLWFCKGTSGIKGCMKIACTMCNSLSIKQFAMQMSPKGKYISSNANYAMPRQYALQHLIVFWSSGIMDCMYVLQSHSCARWRGLGC